MRERERGGGEGGHSGQREEKVRFVFMVCNFDIEIYVGAWSSRLASITSPLMNGGGEPCFSCHGRRINFVALDKEAWSIVISYAGTS